MENNLTTNSIVETTAKNVVNHGVQSYLDNQLYGFPVRFDKSLDPPKCTYILCGSPIEYEVIPLKEPETNALFLEESSPWREKALIAEAWCIYGVYRGFTSVEKTLIDWSESESAARANLDTRLKYNLHKDQYQELVLEKKKAVKDEDGNLTFC